METRGKERSVDEMLRREQEEVEEDEEVDIQAAGFGPDTEAPVVSDTEDDEEEERGPAALIAACREGMSEVNEGIVVKF